MQLDRQRPKLLTSIGVVAALLMALLGIQTGTGPSAHAATNQFHGVNWADPNDNFVTGDVTPVGLSTADSYATTYAKSMTVLRGFQALGANTVRFGFNRATVSDAWWNSYTAAWDAASDLGMNVVVAPWLQSGVIGDTTTFYQMWDVVINKYLGNSHFYFDIMNEPWGYSASQEADVAAAWVAHYPQIPRGRIMVPGAWADQNLCTVGADSRLTGTLLSIHIYSMFGTSHTTEADWINEFNSGLCGYADRAVVTEFGVPMNTGVDYNGAKDGTNNRSYFYAITDTVRSLNMGSILWTGVKETNQTQGPGPCDNASCAITTLNGSGTNLSLTLNNQSGLDRIHYGWGSTSSAIHAIGSGKCLDVPGWTQTNGTQVEIYDCNGGGNQTWTSTSTKQLTVYGGAKCLNAAGNWAGAQVQIADCTTGTNQQWNINTNGTITSVQSGLCLDVTGGSTANQALVEVWTCNNQSNQQWTP